MMPTRFGGLGLLRDGETGMVASYPNQLGLEPQRLGDVGLTDTRTSRSMITPQLSIGSRCARPPAGHAAVVRDVPLADFRRIWSGKVSSSPPPWSAQLFSCCVFLRCMLRRARLSRVGAALSQWIAFSVSVGRFSDKNGVPLEGRPGASGP